MKGISKNFPACRQGREVFRWASPPEADPPLAETSKCSSRHNVSGLRSVSPASNFFVFRDALKLNKTVWIALVILFFSGCTNKRTDPVIISGKLFNSGGINKIYMDRLELTSMKIIDSAEVDEKGEFLFSPEITELGFYRLHLQPNNFFTLIVDTVDSIYIEANANDIGYTFSVKGSESSELMRYLHHYVLKANKRLDSLKQVYSSYQNTPQLDSLMPSLNAAFNTTVSQQKEFIKDFIIRHSTDFSCVAAVNYLDPQTDAEYFITAAKTLKEKYPASPFVQSLHDRALQLSRLAVGTEAPDIILNDPNDKPVSLSSLKGKTVMIDFWASWCRPCRMENPNVVRLYKKFHDKGFEIYGVSLDKEKAAWVNAIQQDGLTWIHVSDLAFWNSSVVKPYNIQGIPMTVLIDKKGKIIAKNLRGEELEKKLGEVLGNE